MMTFFLTWAILAPFCFYFFLKFTRPLLGNIRKKDFAMITLLLMIPVIGQVTLIFILIHVTVSFWYWISGKEFMKGNLFKDVR